MKARLLTALFVGAVVSASLSTSSGAQEGWRGQRFMCPQPQEIRCVPAVQDIALWHDNGGQTTGNKFVPNNQCANVINLGPNKYRLLCCYDKCGTFTRDVDARMCMKVSEAEFSCQ